MNRDASAVEMKAGMAEGAGWDGHDSQSDASAECVGVLYRWAGQSARKGKGWPQDVPNEGKTGVRKMRAGKEAQTKVVMNNIQASLGDWGEGGAEQGEVGVE